MTKTIIALDFPNIEQTRNFLNQFNEPLFVKVGMELYLQQGPAILELLSNLGHHIFLDLKLHDIPNTVKFTMKGLTQFNISMINVHAAGGQNMMQAAKEGLTIGTQRGQDIPKLIAVTQLTSTSEQQMIAEQLIPTTLLDSVTHYAQLTQKSGLDGVVCATSEVAAIRQICGDAFLKVTPGIRLSSQSQDDQVRVATPSMAKQVGATHIVVGRPITQAISPVQVYHQILEELKL